jgi:hypothetical protein
VWLCAEVLHRCLPLPAGALEQNREIMRKKRHDFEMREAASEVRRAAMEEERLREEVRGWGLLWCLLWCLLSCLLWCQLAEEPSWLWQRACCACTCFMHPMGSARAGRLTLSSAPDVSALQPHSTQPVMVCCR